MCGTARTSLHNQHVQAAVRNAHKVHLMPLNTEQNSFQMISMRQAIFFLAKSVNIMSTGNMQICAKTTCSLKAVWKRKSAALHILSNGKISTKG